MPVPDKYVKNILLTRSYLGEIKSLFPQMIDLAKAAGLRDTDNWLKVQLMTEKISHCISAIDNVIGNFWIINDILTDYNNISSLERRLDMLYEYYKNDEIVSLILNLYDDPNKAYDELPDSLKILLE